jgi:putative ABC transport system permease protein
MRFGGLFNKGRKDREFQDELESHIQIHMEDNLRSGMTPEEARRQAMIQMGGIESTKEAYREQRSIPWLETVFQDLQHGARLLRKNPGFTTAAVLTLALGIGANTAIFSVINAVLLRPLPYKDPGKLVMLWERNPRRGFEQEPVTPPDLADWQEQCHVFDQMAYWSGQAEYNLADVDGAEKVNCAYASSSLFPLLGVTTMSGRTFLPEEDQIEGNLVAVIGYQLWQRRFAGDPNVIGRTLTIDTFGRRDYTIIGIMPSGFGFPDHTQIWLPTGWNNVPRSRRDGHWLQVIARVKAGVTRDQAQAEMNGIQARIAQQYPDAVIGSQVAMVPLLDQAVGRNLRSALLILWGIVVCVLLIACANVANLLLAWAASRQKEIAIRLTLGASQWRVVRLLLSESLLLALLGGTLGAFLALCALRLFTATNPGHIPRVEDVGIDRSSLVFTLLVSTLTGVLFGLAPAWQCSRTDLNETLRAAGRGATSGLRRSRFRSLLVVSEISLSLVLLMGAGLMTRSFVRLVRIHRGFQADHLLTAELDFSVSGFTGWVEPTSTRPQVALRELVERIRNQPDVQSVGAASKLPRDQGTALTQAIVIEEKSRVVPGQYLTADFQGITPDYLRTMGVPLLRGRPVSEDDTYEAPRVALINEALAKRYFPGEDPIGQHFALGDPNQPGQPSPANTNAPASPWFEIVGIVSDVRDLSLKAETGPTVYVSYWQWPIYNPTIVVRTKRTPSLMASTILREVKAVNKSLPLPAVQTMDEVLAETVAQPRFYTGLSVVFGVIALLLATIGIYGLISYSVAQRTHEIGIRMALGARTQNVVALVIGEGMKLALIGIGIGVLAALALTRVIASLLYEVTPTDPLTLGGTAFLLLIIAFFAAWIPARRAARVDPMVALRCE